MSNSLNFNCAYCKSIQIHLKYNCECYEVLYCSERCKFKDRLHHSKLCKLEINKEIRYLANEVGDFLTIDNIPVFNYSQGESLSGCISLLLCNMPEFHHIVAKSPDWADFVKSKF